MECRTIEGGEYVVALVQDTGQPAAEVLTQRLPELIGRIRFDKSMRWNASGVAFSRPIRWLVALFGEGVIPFEYADLWSGRMTRGTRPTGSPEIELNDAASYAKSIEKQGIIIDPAQRRDEIARQIQEAARQVYGHVLWLTSESGRQPGRAANNIPGHV
jgi:glycyl-tRNA synthetase